MSDIRKIQTGSNQYTLHARVSDKLAVSAQVGSDTKPVYVDSSGDVQACSREIPNIPYSVTKISSYLIGDFYYNAVYSYDGPGDNYMLRFFYLEPGDKIIVHTTDSYNLPLYFVNDDESFKLEVRVNTPVTVNDHVECVLRGQQHQDLPEGYVEIYRNNSTTTDTFRLISDELNGLLSKQQANSLYVEKTNGPFCRYKGSVDSLSNLPSIHYLTREHIGDVYKIRTASTNNSITTNPGDYVVFVWDKTEEFGHWDNLSGTVDLSNYLQKGGKQTTTSTTDGGSNVYTFKDGSTITVKNGSKGSTGAAATWFSGGAVTGTSTTAKTFTVSGSKAGDMYLNTGTSNVYKATAANQWVYLCNIKGAKGDAANIPKLAKGVAGIVPGTINDSLSASRWLNGGNNGIGEWRALPTAGGGTSGMVRTCKDYTGSIDPTKISGYGHGTTPPTLQPITSGASDYRGVESDGSGRLFVNVPAYEKNINRAQNTVLAAPTTGTGTATFRKLTTSDIPWGDKLKVVTESQFNSTTPRAGVFYFVLEE